jgi:hypothetical protein
VQRDGHAFAFNIINAEIYFETASRFMTGQKSVQENLNAIGVSDLSWITHPTSSAAIRTKELIMSAIPRETQDHHDLAGTAQHLVRKSFHPQWVFERLLGKLLVILKKCNKRESELERGASKALLRRQYILDAGMMDYVHFIQAFDKAIERVQKYSSAFDPFLDYRDWEIEVDKEVYFNSDDEEEDKRPLPSWINEWSEEANERVEDGEGKPKEDKKERVNRLKGLGLGFPGLRGLRSVTSRM